MEEATVLPTTTKTYYKYQWLSINHTSENLPLLSMLVISLLIDFPLLSCLKTTTRMGMRSNRCFRFQVSKMKINSGSLMKIMKMKTIRYLLNKITALLSSSLLLSSPSKAE
jgi:hypothetical protein